MIGTHGSLVFRDRAAAARQLAKACRELQLRDPLVLAIPRGGVVTGAVLAKELGAELDVVLARKLRMPYAPEVAMGALGEDGSIVRNRLAWDPEELPPGYWDEEVQTQRDAIDRRKRLIRKVRPPARIAGRSVIVTDDGLATGATMIAALQCARTQQPFELIAAVPVASPDRLAEVQRHCDRVVCLTAPDDFQAVGQFYENFDTVEDDEVLRLLGDASAAP